MILIGKIIKSWAAEKGRVNASFELFEHSDHYDVIYNQIQSEQATKFL